MTIRIRIVSAGVLAMGVALACWPAASLAQSDGTWGAATYQMATQHGGSGSFGASNNDDRGPTGQQSYEMGVKALAAGKLHEAERDFEHAVNADRKNAAYLAMRGVARSRQDDLSGAAQDLEKALKLDPTQIVAVREYGVVLAKQGKADNAKAQLSRLKLQAEECADTCPDAAKLKEAEAAVQDAIAQAGGSSGRHS